MSNNTSVNNRWSSNFAYVLAATGAAVGLGNIWKFPYIMGENGGGAFVLVYLLCIMFIGIPVMMAEVYLGKQGRSTPANAVAKVALEHGRSKHWAFIGGMGVLAGFLVLSFYIVIAGWAVAYVFKSLSGDISAAAGNAEQVGAMFGALTSDPLQLTLWASIVIGATILVLAKGVTKGLERVVYLLMPALFVLLAMIMVYAAVTGDFAAAVNFMFKPDFSKLTVHGVMIALGHAFFTLSLSSGIMMIYGAYLPEGTSIAKTSIYIAIADTVVALMAGLAIYPIVFAHGIEPSAGPGLLFVSLPIAFGSMPMGSLVSVVFFVMVVVAAFTSAIALLESSAAYLVERRGLRRNVAAVIAGFAVWLLSLGTIASFSGWEFAQIDAGPMGSNFFEILDYLTASVLLPLGGLLITIFVGWMMQGERVKQGIGMKSRNFSLFMKSVRFISPIAIALVFLNAVGLLAF
ncbi:MULTISPECIES: sodium-dependent transporter [unclassified Agarivorans]|uniref:sodium-dependent transporter n=1 Tax=unclassified Agarivorans TaxID=2636026 RepID=UPI003D7EB17B